MGKSSKRIPRHVDMERAKKKKTERAKLAAKAIKPLKPVPWGKRPDPETEEEKANFKRHFADIAAEFGAALHKVIQKYECKMPMWGAEGVVFSALMSVCDDIMRQRRENEATKTLRSLARKVANQ